MAANKPDPASTRTLVEMASGLPIEYRADIIFSLLVQAPDAVSGSEKRLIKQIFDEAEHAKYRTPLLDATNGSNLLAHQQALNLSWLHVDALDLQLHALSLLHLSPAAEFSWFERVQLSPVRADCAQATVEDYTSYYRKAAEILSSESRDALPATRAGANDRIREIVEHAKTPSQMSALFESLPSFDVAPGEESQLPIVVVALTRNMTATDREMSAIEGRAGTLSGALKKILQMPAMAGPARVALLESYRAFLINSLHSEACGDYSLDRSTVAKNFNSLDPDVIGEAPKPIQPLLTAELAPTSVKRVAPFPAITGMNDQLDQLHRLFGVFAANQQERDAFSPAKEYKQPEAADVREILAKATDQDAAIFKSDDPLLNYENRQSTLMLLVELLPPGPSFRDAVDAEVAFLNLHSVEESDPPSWLRAFKELILISRPASAATTEDMKKNIAAGKGYIMLPTQDGAFVLSTLRRYQSDRIISAYARYEATVHPAYSDFEQATKIW